MAKPILLHMFNILEMWGLRDVLFCGKEINAVDGVKPAGPHNCLN